MRRYGRWIVDWPMVTGACAFVFVGGGFCTMGGYHLFRTADFLRDADRVTATVIAQEVSPGENGATYRPTVAYLDRGGVEREARTELSSSSYGHSVGSSVEIHANPRSPGVVRMGGFADLWLFGAGFFLLGGIFPPLGLWILLRFGVRRQA